MAYALDSQHHLPFVVFHPPAIEHLQELGIAHKTHKSEAVDSYSGTSLIRTPLGPSFSGRIIEVSSFQGYSVGVA